MKKFALLCAGASLLIGSTTIAIAAPEDLLPSGFGDPDPAPAPTPTATVAPQVETPVVTGGTEGGTSQAVVQGEGGQGSTSSAVVQALPSAGSVSGAGPIVGSGGPITSLPSLAELDAMEAEDIDQLLGLKPKFDIPPAARRSMEQIGVVGSREGGFAPRSLASQPSSLVRAALRASDGPLVSRWGHILMRRVLASRLDAPSDMDPVEFAALRARSLNGMGESTIARALVQDVDGNNFNRALTDAAFDSYVATGDILGMCPVARLRSDLRDDDEWEMLKAICASFSGEARNAQRRLRRSLGERGADEIDIRLSQRYAGAAGDGRRAVNIEWDGVEELTPWRFALARALGVEVPEGLWTASTAGRFALRDIHIPASPLLNRVQAGDRAAGRGVLSSSAMVDLYSALWSSEQYSDEQKMPARRLRAAYTDGSLAGRMSALRGLWGTNGAYGRKVLTAYASARIPVNEQLAEDAPQLISSMLAAGLDQSALRWGMLVPEGSQGWAMLVLAQPQRDGMVDGSAVERFIGADDTEGARKAAFLLAGLAGLGRISDDDKESLESDLGIDLDRQSVWSDRIDRAAQLDNAALVAMLAGLGMQGVSWDQMTARQLYKIVHGLNEVGLSAEARMIAAEAVARG